MVQPDSDSCDCDFHLKLASQDSLLLDLTGNIARQYSHSSARGGFADIWRGILLKDVEQCAVSIIIWHWHGMPNSKLLVIDRLQSRSFAPIMRVIMVPKI